MRIINNINEMHRLSVESRKQGMILGLVPTMGYLHAGHMALVTAARKCSEVVVVSNFVNPMQFGPNEDYSKYPRDMERDNSMCGEAGVDVVFCPSAESMYSPDTSVSVNEDRLSKVLCGASRPGHFRGVLTVVAKLFNIVQPDVAVFGQKDAQQVRVISRMVRDLDIPVRIVVHPIVREPDGLAMSSRNTYLSVSERKQACGIYKALQAAADAFKAGQRSGPYLVDCVRNVLAATGLVCIDYVSLVDDATLEPVTRVCDRAVLLAVAVRVGKTRLIDNVVLSPCA